MIMYSRNAADTHGTPKLTSSGSLIPAHDCYIYVMIRDIPEATYSSNYLPFLTLSSWNAT